jgi:ACS family sodium-dependent inorganic phosphate cotransporter
VALITAALGLSSFSLAGLYCTHQDLSPKYSSAMLGLTNTSGAIPGVFGVAITGFLYDQTNSWPVALFLPTAFFLLTGSLVYTFLGKNEEEDYDLPGLDEPFGIERAVTRPFTAVTGRVGGVAARVKGLLGLGKGKQQ